MVISTSLKPLTQLPVIKKHISYIRIYGSSTLSSCPLSSVQQFASASLLDCSSSARLLRAIRGRGAARRVCPTMPKVASRIAASMEGKREPLRLVTYRDGKAPPSVGLLREGHVVSLAESLSASDVSPDVLASLGTMMGVIEHWDTIEGSIRAVGEGKKLGGYVSLLAPIPRPAGTIMCVGKNYLDHVKEVDKMGIAKPNVPKYPIIFTKAPQSVIGTGAAIRYPHGVTTELDYEAELAVVIGKGGLGIKRENAMEHIFGYTIVNDVTARDAQRQHQQFFIGKSQDTFCPMGPCIVPASQLDPHNLTIRCWIDGQLRQEGNTSSMIFGIEELIEIISRGITLQAGDILATGTPAGVAAGFDPPRWLVPGSQLKIAIEVIGELHNYVE